jgi:hypothetical protein
MAIAFVANRGTASGSVSSGAQSTFTFSPNATCAAGDLVVIGLALKFNVTDRSVSSVADNSGGGNAWQVDQQVANGLDNCALISCVLAGQITSSTVITVTLSGVFGTGNILTWLADLEEYSGVATSSWFDVGATATSSGTALTAGTTASATAGDMGLAYWAMTVLASSFTPGAGYTAFTEVSQTLQALLGEYQLNVSGAQSATGTSGTSGTWAGVQGTYKAAAAAAAPHVATAQARKRRAVRPRKRRSGSAIDSFAALYTAISLPTGTLQAKQNRRRRRPLYPLHRRVRQSVAFALRQFAVTPPVGTVETFRRRRRTVQPPNRRHHVHNTVLFSGLVPPPVGTVEATRHRRRPLLTPNRRHHVRALVLDQPLAGTQPRLPLLGVGS